MNTKKRTTVRSIIPIRDIKVECVGRWLCHLVLHKDTKQRSHVSLKHMSAKPVRGGEAIKSHCKFFRVSKSSQLQRCFLGQKSPCNYIISRMLQENAVIGHPGRKHRRITMAIPFASMPPHSSHAQMAARFFGCALIIVPLVRGYMSFRPRMNFDGQNHAGRPSRQSYVCD